MKMIMGALATEWVKLRSVRSTWWALIGAVVLMAIVGSANGSDGRGGAESAGAIVGPTVIALGRSDGIDPWATVQTLLLISLYTAMISMIALGVGFLTRSTAATATLIFLLVMIIPSLLAQLGQLLNSQLIMDASDYFPGVAARIMISGEAAAYGPGVAVLVLAGWVVTSLVAAGAVFSRRDA